MIYVFFSGYGHWEFHQLDKNGEGLIARISPVHKEAAVFSLKDRKDELNFQYTGDVMELIPAEGHEHNIAQYVFERVREPKPEMNIMFTNL